jgi:hypothetical protein
LGQVERVKFWIKETFNEKSEWGRYLLKENLPVKILINCIEKCDNGLDWILKLQNIYI